MKYYFTFGSAHRHIINGKLLKGGSIAVVEAETEGYARKIMSDAIGLAWSHTYLSAEDAGKSKYNLIEVELTTEDLEQGKLERDERLAKADLPIGIHWFSEGKGTLGIITKKDKITGEIKAYIGSAVGHDEEEDIKYILEWGSKVEVERLEKILKEMKGTE